jgi:hypothetical protein
MYNMREPNRRGWRSDDRRWGVHVELLWANLSHSLGGKTSKNVQHFCKKVLWLFYFGFIWKEDDSRDSSFSYVSQRS